MVIGNTGDHWKKLLQDFGWKKIFILGLCSVFLLALIYYSADLSYRKSNAGKSIYRGVVVPRLVKIRDVSLLSFSPIRPKAKFSGVEQSRFHQPFQSAQELPILALDIKFKHMEKLKAIRKTIQKQILPEHKVEMPARIRSEGRSIKVKLRFKGDMVDHIRDEKKWSFRIKVKRGKHIFGMREFSIQSPKTRRYHLESIYQTMLKEVGVLAPRYFFVNVTINGEDIGVMAVEEHFSKELLESQGRRESVIVRFDEDLFCQNLLVARTGPFSFFTNNRISAFNQKTIKKKKKLNQDYQVATGLLRGWVEGKLEPSQVFDLNLMTRFLSVGVLLSSRHNSGWHNMRFYYNPITGLLEPIGFDSNTKPLGQDEKIN